MFTVKFERKKMDTYVLKTEIFSLKCSWVCPTDADRMQIKWPKVKTLIRLLLGLHYLFARSYLSKYLESLNSGIIKKTG